MADGTTQRAELPPQASVIRLGYVGAGFMAQSVHLPNFAALSGCRLVALAEKRPALAQKVAGRFGIPKVYPTHLALADDANVDAVAVSADYAQQGEIAAALLRAGKPVFMEKPMAVSLRQAHRILEAERAGKARLMVGYMKRYDPANRLARETIRRWRQEAAKGRLLFARAHGFCGDWLAGLDASGLIRTDEPLETISSAHLLPEWLPADYHRAYLEYLQQFTHNLNLLRFLLDVTHQDQLEVRSVDLDPDGFTGVVTLRLGGTRCALESGRTGFHGWEEHTQLYFEGGWVRVSPGPFFARPSTGQVELYEARDGGAYRYPSPQPMAAWHYREEAAHFVARLENGAPFDSSGQDALLDVWLFEQIYRQHLGLTS